MNRTAKGVKIRWKSGETDILALSDKSLMELENLIHSTKSFPTFIQVRDRNSNVVLINIQNVQLLQFCNISMRLKDINPLNEDYDNPLR